MSKVIPFERTKILDCGKCRAKTFHIKPLDSDLKSFLHFKNIVYYKCDNCGTIQGIEKPKIIRKKHRHKKIQKLKTEDLGTDY